MNKKFYEKKFDHATQVKLDVFRLYLQEWLPVFASKGEEVSIYDFFAGPGKDAAGNPGSSLIIVEELKRFCEHYASSHPQVSARIVFNDIEEEHSETLKGNVYEVACGKSCCKFEFSAKPFSESLDQHFTRMQAPGSANLVFMDQFGIKEVTPEVVGKMAKCSRTDILFFISSSIVNRFVETPEIGSKFDISSEALRDKEYTVIHRYLCDHFREKLNIALNEFCLLKGFSPSKTNEVLRRMQSSGSIKVWDITKDKPARKNSFYLGWVNVKTGRPRVRYTSEIIL